MVPAQAQVLKGSKPEDEATKASTVKSSKAAREKAAAKDAVAYKEHQGQQQTKDASSKIAVKIDKASAEQDAAKVQMGEKPRKADLHGVKNDAITVKQKTQAGTQAGKIDTHLKWNKTSAATSTAHPVGEKRDKAEQEKTAPPK